MWDQNQRPCEKVKEILKVDQIYILIYFNRSLKLVLEYDVSIQFISEPPLRVMM